MVVISELTGIFWGMAYNVMSTCESLVWNCDKF